MYVKEKRSRFEKESGREIITTPDGDLLKDREVTDEEGERYLYLLLGRNLAWDESKVNVLATNELDCHGKPGETLALMREVCQKNFCTK